MSTYDTLHGWGSGLTTHTMYAIRATSVESGRRGYLQLTNNGLIINFDGTPFTHSNGTPIYAHILKCRDVVLTEYVDKFKDIVIYEYKEVANNDNDDTTNIV